MGVSYNPLWKLLIDKKMNRTRLAAEAGISRVTIAKMGKDEYVALDILEKICLTLNCAIEDVVEITVNEKKE